MNLDPNQVTVGNDSVPDSWKVCVIEGVIGGDIEYNGSLGARISSVFVIFAVSTFLTLFPLVAKRVPSLRIPTYVYLFARHFGSGVIVATAYVHLMDPAYGEIGPNTCVGMTGHWADYSFVAAIMLGTVYFIFLLDLASAVYVQRRYGIIDDHHEEAVEDLLTDSSAKVYNHHSHQQAGIVESGQNTAVEATAAPAAAPQDLHALKKSETDSLQESLSETELEKSFESQFAAFLILEFGVLFHSVMIGLNLGTTGDEFKTLYIVLVFHQSFEGLGIGARLSAIPFPAEKHWWPYALCIAYGLTTPICVAIGLGVRHTYMGNSFNVNIISGVLDAMSAGILMYTGLVELLARDFIFNDQRTTNLRRLAFMVFCNILGAGIMALLGKWA